MADDSISAQTPAARMQEIQNLSETLLALKEQAEVAVRAAEQASSKANSESGFAYNAKQNAEEHAKAISQIHGSVEADFNWLATTKNNAEDAAQAITRAKVSSETDAQILAQAKASVEEDANLARAARENIDGISAAFANAQADATTLLNRISEDAAAVTQARATAEASTTTVQVLQAQVTEGAAKAESDASTIARRESESQALLRSLADVAATANAAHTRVAEHEKNLEQLREQFAQLHATIEGLLPGATSAGLASAFRDQKARFIRSQRNWVLVFVAAIALLLIAGLVGLPGLWLREGSPGSVSWDSILRHIASRLPLVLPLVWLGIYAGRNYMLALRVQEDYAFKEAVSASFEGYKREMAGISSGQTEGVPPIQTLCENVLRVLAQRPGRIYEGRQEDITPLTPVAKALGAAADIVKSATKEG